MTDSIQGDPVSHRARLNQPQSGCMLRDEVIDWRLLVYEHLLTYWKRSAPHSRYEEDGTRIVSRLSLLDPSTV